MCPALNVVDDCSSRRPWDYGGFPQGHAILLTDPFLLLPLLCPGIIPCETGSRSCNPLVKAQSWHNGISHNGISHNGISPSITPSRLPQSTTSPHPVSPSRHLLPTPPISPSLSCVRHHRPPPTMPIFHDPDQPSPRNAIPAPKPVECDSIIRRLSEESIRTEFCDGPIMDTDMEDPFPVDGGAGNLAPVAATLQTSDRGELIERIKRGESPTWVPNAAVRCGRVFACMQQSHSGLCRFPFWSQDRSCQFQMLKCCCCLHWL